MDLRIKRRTDVGAKLRVIDLPVWDICPRCLTCLNFIGNGAKITTQAYTYDVVVARQVCLCSLDINLSVFDVVFLTALIV
jgi:hypothetical protein